MYDAYLRIDGIKGESSDEKHRDWIETVKAGEITLAQVAVRLGTNEGHLLSANPQIKDPHNLKVGQEIHLPTHPSPKSENSVATPPATVHATDLPKAPLGDPLVANMVKESLLGSTKAKLEAADAKIDSKVKEAEQKFANAMDAANMQMTLSTTHGVGTAAGVLQSSDANRGQTIAHKGGANQRQELLEASLEYCIAVAASEVKGDVSKDIAQLENDLAKLESSKLHRLISDESRSQSTLSGTESTQNNPADQGIDRRKFIKL